MSIILNIETTTKNCSVSIAEKGEILAIKELNNGNYSHAEVLHPFILDVLKEANLTSNRIDAVAVSKGPGSYTGLRIGVSAAKGLCFALDKPLISIDTLTSLSFSITIEEGIIVPMLDARRLEVYASVFNEKHQKIREIKAEIIDENSFCEYLERSKVYFLGDGSQKCKEIITHKNAIFIDAKFPSAQEMAKLSYEKYKISDIENVAYFEPFYLKDFIVIPEKKKKPTF
ncbi:MULTISPECIES: tRNA (adenosine(37)-N6)-threonylcarbamoyltransferase complex dimerization subunit type 1 TsaB [unclassified Polaribacter]|uniref:tRNA (adenosine(37)-N6)-threonylcarbamoyltransferase complex dimerization subunit type 1 TsaB n=1 Tax=unclassified Polaribacter TaxID=196858 RepID=UPI000C706492|nr:MULTISPECIES: tRNA (adenosine(37)-N6)-threonylcarbamoyltransferase complex dimerization subunit type 1 TsaB [unclassified Polaribacter]MBT3742710.1 tRNA (adenosine(37)-N6)-threonylcarbamoyltransferase complex dimerization subunit type 1 TsaB [Polaribacter sp.]MBT4413784.1 tRNA (adenosine(37)-N6)-threonylcarbamoyltransferase complex dimerization subunit type 1 TsaB [Polaribacter sp.]MBT7816995.1 tRNA (adenosine(37)-N6)-threonylcarbamoyltransferase complex dimerization subunit type 1 TsaB [Pola